MDLADRLRTLVRLRADGVISESEFQTRQAALLAEEEARDPVTSAGAIPVSLGAYDLIELVGEGGMGVVYRARHRVQAIAARQGGDVAIKVLHTHLATKSGFSARFRSEAETLGALDHHNVVRVHDLVEEQGRLALVMEWIPGRPLSYIIGSETGPVPWERATIYVRQLISGVKHAHARGVIHRDLKPENVRVTPEGLVKILDFGIARLGQGRGRTKTGTELGTVDYMAPEQYVNASAVDHRADIYALGMTLYETVAGRLPWDAKETEFGVMQRKHNGQIPPPTTYYPEIPPHVVDTIMATLSPDPGARPATAADLEASLFPDEPVQHEPVNVRPSPPPAPIDTRPAEPPPPAPKPARGHTSWVFAIGALCTIGALVWGVRTRDALRSELSSLHMRNLEITDERDRVQKLLEEVQTKLTTTSSTADGLRACWVAASEELTGSSGAKSWSALPSSAPCLSTAKQRAEATKALDSRRVERFPWTGVKIHNFHTCATRPVSGICPLQTSFERGDSVFASTEVEFLTEMHLSHQVGLYRVTEERIYIDAGTSSEAGTGWYAYADAKIAPDTPPGIYLLTYRISDSGKNYGGTAAQLIEIK